MMYSPRTHNREPSQDKPVSLLVSVRGGMLAGAVFKQIWKLAARG